MKNLWKTFIWGFVAVSLGLGVVYFRVDITVNKYFSAKYEKYQLDRRMSQTVSCINNSSDITIMTVVGHEPSTMPNSIILVTALTFPSSGDSAKDDVIWEKNHKAFIVCVQKYKWTILSLLYVNFEPVQTVDDNKVHVMSKPTGLLFVRDVNMIYPNGYGDLNVTEQIYSLLDGGIASWVDASFYNTNSVVIPYNDDVQLAIKRYQKAFAK